MNTEKKQYKATIIEQNIIENSAFLLLQIDPEIVYFDGHFDNYPILAGVTQLDWAIYYGKTLLSANSVFDGMEVIKFQQPILPNTLVLLTLRWEKEKNKLYFSYTSGENQSHASGRIKLVPTQ